MPGPDATPASATNPTTAPATFGPATSSGSGPGATTAPAADPWKAFTDAAAAYDGPNIQARWAALAPPDKLKLKADGDTQMHIVTTLHKDAIPILAQGSVDFTAMQTVYAAYLSADFASWMAPLKTNNIFDAFLNAPPKNQALGIVEAKKLSPWVAASASAADAKKIFNHVFQPVQDAYSRSGWTVATAAWTVPTVAQLYDRIVSYNLPIGPANTIRAWYMVTAGSNYVQPGGGGAVNGALYWGGSMNEVWFTDSQTTQSAGVAADGTSNVGGGAGKGGSGWTGHDGVGGTGSGASSTATNPLDHFTNAVLHEIGHGVGDRIEGNTWAESNPYTHFVNRGQSDFGSDLWSGDFFRGVGDFFGTTDYTQDECRKYMLDDIAGKTPAAPHGTLPAFLSYIDSTFSSQELYKAWKKSLGNGERYKNPWFHGDKAYAFLSRWGSAFATYNKKAWDERVSDYSMSSPKEFFAEQYTEYYRPCISAADQTAADAAKGSTIREPSVKAYLDQVDKRGFDPNTGTATGTPATTPGASGGAASAPAAAAPAPPIRPIPWP